MKQKDQILSPVKLLPEFFGDLGELGKSDDGIGFLVGTKEGVSQFFYSKLKVLMM